MTEHTHTYIHVKHTHTNLCGSGGGPSTHCPSTGSDGKLQPTIFLHRTDMDRSIVPTEFSGRSQMVYSKHGCWNTYSKSCAVVV